MGKYEVKYRGKTWLVQGFGNTIRHATYLWKESVAWRRTSGNHKFPEIKELVK